MLTYHLTSGCDFSFAVKRFAGRGCHHPAFMAVTFHFPYDVVSASSPDPVEDATVLGQIKMLWGSSGETYLSLH